MSGLSLAAERILNPTALIAAADVRTAPAFPGIYGWWIRRGALDVPEALYRERDGHQLLYVGISPSRAASAGTMRKRLVQHVYGNASQSTLRRTLGVLLSEQLDLTLALYNGRAHYGTDGEARITRWMQGNARAAWAVDAEPWVVEHELLASAVLVLNIDGRGDDFVRSISARRSAALAAAKGQSCVRPQYPHSHTISDGCGSSRCRQPGQHGTAKASTFSASPRRVMR